MNDPRQMRVLLMGTPTLARDVFAALQQDGYNIVGLVCQPDQRVGRNQQWEKPPTKIWAESHHIPVFQPEKIRTDHAFLNGLDIDFILTLAYGQIVPQIVLDKPRFGAYNFHGSILPKYRGASPLRFALINQETETGMTLMKMVLAMDAGPIYALKKLAILPDDNYSSLLQRYSAFTASFALQTIPKLFRGELSPITQDERLVSFAPLIKKEDEHLSLALPLANFIGWVKGLSDEPGGYLMVEDKKLKIYHVSIVSNETLAPVGTLIKVDHQAIHLQVLGGVISLDHLQLEGKPKMLGPIFGNGHRHLLNQVLR
jgi:methionyl-tRNA formyltransferase